MSSIGSWAIGEGTDSYSLTYGKDFEYVPVPQYGDKMAFGYQRQVEGTYGSKEQR